MSNPVGGAGAASLAALRSKMQGLKDDVEKARDLFEQKCKELEREKTVRQQVGNGALWLNERLNYYELFIAHPTIFISCRAHSQA